jgi:hypothetical protein
MQCPLCLYRTKSSYNIAVCGNCKNCNNQIPYNVHQYCSQCSISLNSCFYCGNNLKSWEDYEYHLKELIDKDILRFIDRSKTMAFPKHLTGDFKNTYIESRINSYSNSFDEIKTRFQTNLNQRS